MRSANKSSARISGNNFAPVMFLIELQIQCNLISKSAGKLEKAIAYWKAIKSGIEIDGQGCAPIDIVATCSVILSAVASIRRILFLGDRKGKKHTLTEKRCTALMELLGSPDLPCINSAEVRNAWDHMDERLDEFLKDWDGGSISSIHIASAPPNKSVALRRFDPANFSILFANKEISLSSCIEESKLLSERVDMTLKKLQSQSVSIYG